MRGASVLGVLARGGFGCSARAAARTGPGNGAAAGRVSGGRRERERTEIQEHSTRREGFLWRGPRRGAAGAALALAVTLAACLVGTGGVAHAQSNNAPTVANPLEDQTASPDTAFSYQFPTNTFADADSDTLTYTATQSDSTALPSWLSFTASTRTFAGTPQAADMGTVSVEVTANDNNGGTVTDTFDIEVRGVCERTQGVRRGIEDTVPGVRNCSHITSAHLAAIHSLNFTSASFAARTLSSLRSGDFAGLTGLQELSMRRVSSGRIMTLPADIFDGLTALVTLDLRENDIRNLPAGVFDDLTADAASTRTMLLLTSIGPGDRHPRTVSSGVYRDEWRRTAEGWRIARRVADMDRPAPDAPRG